MRLTTTLSYFISPRKIPYRYRGKNRLERPPTLKNLIRLRNDLEIQEQNMLLLRHPYITSEQSFGHMAEFKQEKYAKVWRGWQEERNIRFNKRITIADRLNHLVVREVWD